MTRSSDLLARYGGEEFTILLPGADLAEAAAIVDRIRTATPRGQTCSAGITTWDGSESAHRLLERADEALYEASREDGTASSSPASPDSCSARDLRAPDGGPGCG